MKLRSLLLTAVVVFTLVTACSPVRFVPEGDHMLTNVSLKSTDKAVRASDYRSYVRQEANSRWLNFMKVPMGIYCLSGTDSTRRFNRFMHRIGEAPVVYDADLAEYSRRSIEGALRTKG